MDGFVQRSAELGATIPSLGSEGEPLPDCSLQGRSLPVQAHQQDRAVIELIEPQSVIERQPVLASEIALGESGADCLRHRLRWQQRSEQVEHEKEAVRGDDRSNGKEPGSPVTGMPSVASH
jgi:hypothetical protein